jgi:hypothetical protein
MSNEGDSTKISVEVAEAENDVELQTMKELEML